jgi:hypothetical protein
MTGWVVARAAILAALALAGLAGAGLAVAAAQPGVVLAVALPAAVTFALLLWHLPAAMQVPAIVHSGPAGRGGLPG